MNAEVIIVGGGIIGCAAAYNLAKNGVSVLVLEGSENIGNGGSTRNGGGVRQSGRDPRELPLVMYSIEHIWPQLSDMLDTNALAGRFCRYIRFRISACVRKMPPETALSDWFQHST